MSNSVAVVARWVGAVFLFVAGVGCGPDDTSCDAAKGRFTVNYQYVDGDCMPGAQDVVDINICTTGNSQSITGANGYTLETEITATGCTINVSQISRANNELDWMVSGDLDVDNASMLHGRITRQHFGEGKICAGTYDVVLEKVEDNPPECMSRF